jgi:hypothetical protein
MLLICSTEEGNILYHMLTTANQNDAAVAPDLIASLAKRDIEFALGDAITVKRFDKQPNKQEEEFR